MTQQRKSGSELQGESPAAPVSDRCARRISVIESIDRGIKVRDGHSFDPHRFQEFDFTPEFRDKIMRASLPLLDLRPLLQDQPSLDNWRHAGPNDTTRPANGTPTLTPSNVTPPLPEGPGLRKVSNRGLGGKPAKKWKLLLFGGLLTTLWLPAK